MEAPAVHFLRLGSQKRQHCCKGPCFRVGPHPPTARYCECDMALTVFPFWLGVTVSGWGPPKLYCTPPGRVCQASAAKGRQSSSLPPDGPTRNPKHTLGLLFRGAGVLTTIDVGKDCLVYRFGLRMLQQPPVRGLFNGIGLFVPRLLASPSLKHACVPPMTMVV